MADPVADQERRAARKKAKKEKRAADGSRAAGSGIYQLAASGFLSQRQNKSGARSAKSNFQRSLSLYGEGRRNFSTTGAGAQAHSTQQLEIVPPTLAEVEQMDALRALESTALGSESRPLQSPQRVSLNGHFLNAEMNPHAGGGSRILAYGTKLFHGNVKNN
eukprot:g8741.t1